MSDVRVTVGQRIARLRKAKGLSQRQLADKLGVSFSQISDLEDGTYTRAPNGWVIREMSRVLECGVYDLIPDEEPTDET